jgi:methylphosphotriester-DNA--protein-cysteine methyltransferase
VPAIILDNFWKVPAQHPEAAFLRWLDAFFEEFRRMHPLSVATKVSRLIKHDYRRSYNHTDLARRFHVTPLQLRREFQREFGVSIRECQREKRVIAALEQMTTGKIEAIALQVGYRSKKNFYRALKRVIGLTPTAFRQLSHERARHLIETVCAKSSRRATAADRER